MRIITILIAFFSFATQAEFDPCELNNYPMKWQRELSPALAYEIPAIYSGDEDSKVIVSASDAIAFIETNMADHQPYLKTAKDHILRSLKGLRGDSFVEQSELWLTLDGLQGEELNVGIHVMAGYKGLFERFLFNSRAAVEVGGSLVENTTGTYMVGKDPKPSHGMDYVHKLVIEAENQVIFTKCWLDSTI